MLKAVLVRIVAVNGIRTWARAIRMGRQKLDRCLNAMTGSITLRVINMDI